ncbi:MAG: 2,3-bisphosphoglycerate-independent phosphoglycerate mutase [Candidatus Moranbacteria bacterium]|nr:2,3-bisphosphoglycerate-independent phosphoglycerate mutase [Candidatus Moranbacteria bacterium]
MHTRTNRPVALIILDGWGHRDDPKDNAIASAKKPFFDSLLSTYPHTLLRASESSVGLPDGQMGNSEVGHITIGAGAVMDTDLVRISKAAAGNEFLHNAAFGTLFEHVLKYDSVLHVKGLLSDGGIHSHIDHLAAFLEAAKTIGITKIAIHAFTDGRDTGPQSASAYLRVLEEVIDDLGIGFIATASGRFYAMDRDKNWERTEKTERAIFHGDAGRTVRDRKPSEILTELYAEGVLDEHLEPVVFLDENGEAYSVRENDGILFFNFRSDRSRQLSARTVEHAKEKNLCFVTLTRYDETLPTIVAFPPMVPETTIAREVSLSGLRQTHIAETEKYAHSTYYLNGGHELPYDGEEDILVPSRKDVLTHDEAPEMRAEDIANRALDAIDRGTDFLFINFANADMVGHTGNAPRIVEAIECLDRQLERVVEKVLSVGGIAVITADHGNAELNIDPKTGAVHTAHTLSPVPFIVTAPGTLQPGGLADIAPTVLNLLSIPVPNVMTGKNLFFSGDSAF